MANFDAFSETDLIRRAGEAASALVLEKVHQSQSLCSENFRQSRSNEHLIKLKLEHRIIEVDSWRNILGALTRRLDEQIRLLSEEKEKLGVVLMRIIEEIRNNVHCCKINTAEPYTKELVEIEMENELKLLRGERFKFSLKITELESRLAELTNTRRTLRQDVNLKNHGIRVDKMLADSGPELQMMFVPKFKTKKLKPKETWLQQCERLQAEAEQAITATSSLREECRAMRARLSCAAHAQADRVDAALRRRVHYTRNNLHDLHWQMREVERDIMSLTLEESETEKAMHSCLAQQRLAQATLVARASKADTELCDDDAAQRIKLEISRLRGSVRDLGKNLDNVQVLRNSLTSVRAEIGCHISDKQISLDLDTERMRHRDEPRVPSGPGAVGGKRHERERESRDSRDAAAALEVIYECDEANDGN